MAEAQCGFGACWRWEEYVGMYKNSSCLADFDLHRPCRAGRFLIRTDSEKVNIEQVRMFWILQVFTKTPIFEKIIFFYDQDPKGTYLWAQKSNGHRSSLWLQQRPQVVNKQ